MLNLAGAQGFWIPAFSGMTEPCPAQGQLTGVCNGRLVEVFTPILTFPQPIKGEGTLIEIHTLVGPRGRGTLATPRIEKGRMEVRPELLGWYDGCGGVGRV